MKFKRSIILCLLITGGIYISQPGLNAQDEEVFKCIQVEGAYSIIKGAFDGESILIGGDDEFLLPKLEGNFGFGLFYGAAGNNFSIGIKYYRFQYNTTFLDESLGKANHNMLGMDLRIFYHFEKKDYSIDRPVIQAFVLTGFEFGTLKVEDGCISSWSDSRFVSFGIPVGVGMAINPFRIITVNFDMAYRFAIPLSVKGIDSPDSYSTVGSRVGAGGLRFDIGLSFYWGSVN